ncbi:type IV pilin protein [Lysobacter soli]|uniref:type IV pilin protein n=1 Tax=Lysobacter soli TaxID=453783 RepID=UPI0036C9B2EF
MSKIQSRRGSVRGFTLIELMIVVAVVAILGAIAYPAYTDAVRKSRRGQAKADLLQITQVAERFRTVNGTYEGFEVPEAKQTSPEEGPARYEIEVSNRTASTFTLTATPVTGSGQEHDEKCMELSITQAGVKEASGSDPDACW